MQVIKQLALEKFEVTKDAEGVFEGYASVFSVVDAVQDVIMPGAFSKTLKNRDRAVAMFFNHDSYDIPVGKWVDLKEDDKGLFVRGELTPGLSKSSDILAAMKHGTVTGMSVGFSVGKGDYTENIHGGLDFHNIKNLSEISLCTFPCNNSAQVSSLKSIGEIGTIRDAERTLRDAGFSKSEAVALISRIKSVGRGEHVDDEAEAQALKSLFDKFSFLK